MFYIMLAFVIYLLPLTWIVYKTRWSKSTLDYNLANRTIPAVLVFASVSATYIGPGFSMGFIGKGYYTGLLFWLMGLVYAFQTLFVGSYIAPKLRAVHDASTLGGVYDEKVGKSSQILVGILSFGLCAGFSAVMLKAGGTILSSFFGWPLWIGVVAIGLLTTIYTISGGLRATITTDAFQFMFLSFLIPSVLIWLLLYQHVPGRDITVMLSSLTSSSIKQLGSLEFVALVAAFLLGETMIPPYASRALASTSQRSAKHGFISSGIFAIFWFLLVILIGITARTVLGEGIPEDNVLLTLIKTMPIFYQYLIGLTLLGIVMSSLDSLLNSGAVAFTEDIIANIPKKLSDKNRLMLSRFAVIVITLLGIISSLRIKSIVDGLLLFYSIWAPAIIPSLLYILFVKNPRIQATFLSIIFGTIATLIVNFGLVNTSFPSILVGLIGAMIPLFIIRGGAKK